MDRGQVVLEDRTVLVGDLDSIQGCAKRVGVSAMTVWAWVQGGVVGSTRLGNNYVVHVPEVAEVVRRMPSRRRKGWSTDRDRVPVDEGELLAANG